MIEFKPLSSGSKGNAYRVKSGRSTLLIEAGINYRDIQKGFNFRMSEVSACLLSHSHGDHSKAIRDVLKAGIDCYMPNGTADALNINHHRLKRIEPKTTFKVGELTILAFDVQHDVEAYGYLIQNQQNERLLFITDSYYCKYRFENLTYIAIECNYSKDILDKNILEGRVPQVMRKRLIQSHFSLENVKEFLKANDLSKTKEIWLLHLSDTNSNADLFKREIQSLTGKMVFIA